MEFDSGNRIQVANLTVDYGLHDLGVKILTIAVNTPNHEVIVFTGRTETIDGYQKPARSTGECYLPGDIPIS